MTVDKERLTAFIRDLRDICNKHGTTISEAKLSFKEPYAMFNHFFASPDLVSGKSGVFDFHFTNDELNCTKVAAEKAPPYL